MDIHYHLDTADLPWPGDENADCHYGTAPLAPVDPCPVCDEPPPHWHGSPDPDDPANYWIDDVTGERVSAETGERTVRDA